MAEPGPSGRAGRASVVMPGHRHDSMAEPGSSSPLRPSARSDRALEPTPPRPSAERPGSAHTLAVDYWRQVDLVRPEQLAFPVTVIGVGGVGSPVALALAKMGCPRITLYDPDLVEPHNLPNQLYRLQDVGRPKVEALAEILRLYAPLDVSPVQEAVAGQALEGVVISAVDSMAARTAIWGGSVRFRGSVPLYLDARMGGEVGRVLAVRPADPDQVRAYEATLYADEAAVEDPCTAQAIIYNTLGIAALVANQVKRFARDEPTERDTIFDFATLSLLTGVHHGG